MFRKKPENVSYKSEQRENNTREVDETVRRGAVLTREFTLVCDHRSVNGANAAECCRTLKKVLESPEEAW
ncbi:MAG: 2-oxo acid dehydrogenase subunit E2 [Spirochaetia bacterium]|jgi:pyruvate/2-oxoglutarate dehydrogenase complex dihydrolipoamide acyltransferase (E2) component